MSTFEHTAILTHLHSAQQILALSPRGPCPGCAGAVRPGWRGAALATSPPPTPATGGEWKYSQCLERDNTLKRVTVSNYPLELHSQS